MRHETFTGSAVEIDTHAECTCTVCRPHTRLLALSSNGNLSIDRPVARGGFNNQSLNHAFSHVENIPARVVHPFATIPEDRILHRRAG